MTFSDMVIFLQKAMDRQQKLENENKINEQTLESLVITR